MKLSSYQKIVIPMILILVLTGGGILTVVTRLFSSQYETGVYEENNELAKFVAVGRQLYGYCIPYDGGNCNDRY